MKCVLPGNNVKVFGRAIHCLSKIGDDLYIEPEANGLALRTVNSSRSAYACFMFAPTFFMQYQIDTVPKNNAPDLDEEGDEDPFRCRIIMKSCLSVFKSLSTLEKTVDKCCISLNLKECRLVFQLHCKHGIVKTYNLTYQETETLQAVFSKDLCPNHIVADAKELSDVVCNFQTSQEEVTLSVNPEQVSFRNYVDDEPDPSKVLHSEMFLSPEEFQDCTIGVDTEVTFCLKELRAILAFADGAGLPLSLHFESTGKPIVFNIAGDQVLEATFVLATLADVPSSQMSCTEQSTQQSKTQRIGSVSKHSRSQKVTNRNATQNRSRSRFDLQRLQNGKTQNRPSTIIEPCGPVRKSSILTEHRQIGFGMSRVTASVGDTSAMDVEFPDDIMLAAGDAAMDRLSQQDNRKETDDTATKSNNVEYDGNNEPDRTQDDISPSPVIPLAPNIRQLPQSSKPILRLSPGLKQNTTNKHDEVEDVLETSTSKQNTTLLANFEDEEENDMVHDAAETSMVQDLDAPSDKDEYEFIPGTPPSKKFKSMFFGASQSQSESQASGATRRIQSSTILAEDTDEESD